MSAEDVDSTMEPAAVTQREDAPVPHPLQAATVETSVGKVTVGLLEPRTGTKKASSIALCIHGKSSRPEVIWEWSEMAPACQERGVAVVCPNLHTCDRVAPASASEEDVLAALRDVLQWARERYMDAPVVIYGKSWGGAAAVDLAASEGAAVLGLALVCPSHKLKDLGNKLVSVAAPVLLCWAKDDETIAFPNHQIFMANLKRRPAGPQRTLLEVLDVGGHSVAPFLATGCKSREKLLTWPDLAGFLQKQTGG